MCRILETKGWTLTRISGSHHIYHDGDCRQSVSIPVHANIDLKPGLQLAIMKKAGLTEKDL